MAFYSPNSESSDVTDVAASSRGRLLKFPLEPPSAFEGLLALLVTDLVGFTALVEHLGDVRAQSIMQEHNRILRGCIQRQGGREVTHTGDGLFAAFRSISGALLCAQAMQRELAEYSELHPDVPLRARMGVHAGEPLPEETRLFGHCVNQTVRVCGAASAARVLVSDAVKQLAQGRFEFGAGCMHQLKGMSAPVRLYEFAWESQLDAGVAFAK